MHFTNRLVLVAAALAANIFVAQACAGLGQTCGRSRTGPREEILCCDSTMYCDKSKSNSAAGICQGTSNSYNSPPGGGDGYAMADQYGGVSLISL
ncbi:hypothetical protein Ptr902_08183 [Pyrenophora tritici-repentis]|nr:hypothetical protein Ptr902_08183 [Pyrenophora tritici-repentis]